MAMTLEELSVEVVRLQTELRLLIHSMEEVATEQDVIGGASHAVIKTRRPTQGLDMTEDCYTTRGFVYAGSGTQIYCTALTWWDAASDVTAAAAGPFVSADGAYIVATRSGGPPATTLTVAAQAAAPAGSDANKTLLSTIAWDSTDVDSILRNHVGDIQTTPITATVQSEDNTKTYLNGTRWNTTLHAFQQSVVTITYDIWRVTIGGVTKDIQIITAESSDWETITNGAGSACP